MNGLARLSTGTSPARSSPSYSQSCPVNPLLHRPIEFTALDGNVWRQMRGSARVVHWSGAPGGNRTPDLDVRTVLLYPLSYEGDSRSLVRTVDTGASAR